ncbi:hypothetical protein BN938_0069 [Mucinivorans hirudinis]|uniref:Uncharacterized protein n=1 Tax=Mucinivorans hirudinis TaxID=1433126 RepID=A0A060R5P0_9BACT|nr:hypothetical protein BN938_0069 [Mucinivorans hirudinis]
MTLYQIATRIAHFFTACHWRGADIHSPFVYSFVREYALENRGARLIEAIGVRVIARVGELDVYPDDMIILREPFISGGERALFKKWYEDNHCVVVHFQGLIVIFRNSKLQKQWFKVRN